MRKKNCIYNGNNFLAGNDESKQILHELLEDKENFTVYNYVSWNINSIESSLHLT